MTDISSHKSDSSVDVWVVVDELQVLYAKSSTIKAIEVILQLTLLTTGVY